MEKTFLNKKTTRDNINSKTETEKASIAFYLTQMYQNVNNKSHKNNYNVPHHKTIEALIRKHYQEITIAHDRLTKLSIQLKNQTSVNQLIIFNANKDVLNHVFTQEMEPKQFVANLTELINKSTSTWSCDDLKSFQSDFKKISLCKFCYIAIINSLYPNLMKDCILTSLLPDKYDRDTYGYFFMNQIEIIKFRHIIISNDLQIDINFVKSIMVSPCLINAFNKVFNYLQITSKEDEIKMKINEYLNKFSIYHASFSLKLCGLTVYDGTIYITTKYIKDFKEHSTFNYRIGGAILIAILHEMTHALLRLVGTTNNFYLKTEETLIDNISFDDSGEILEYVLFNNINELYENDTKYILDLKNYSKKAETFKLELQTIHNQSKLCGTNPYHVKQQSGGYPIGRCLFSIVRENEKKQKLEEYKQSNI